MKQLSEDEASNTNAGTPPNKRRKDNSGKHIQNSKRVNQDNKLLPHKQNKSKKGQKKPKISIAVSPSNSNEILHRCLPEAI